MGNCNATIFLRQDCYLPGVCSYLYAISNGGTLDSSRENAIWTELAWDSVLSFPLGFDDILISFSCV